MEEGAYLVVTVCPAPRLFLYSDSDSVVQRQAFYHPPTALVLYPSSQIVLIIVSLLDLGLGLPLRRRSMVGVRVGGVVSVVVYPSMSRKFIRAREAFLAAWMRTEKRLFSCMSSNMACLSTMLKSAASFLI